MKKLILITISLLIWAGIAQAKSLSWQPPDTGTSDGYIVYYTDGTDERSNDVGDVLSVDLNIFNLTPGTYEFYVTAYNVMGESDPSNTVDYLFESFVPNDNPKPVTIIIPGPITIIIGN